MALPESSRLCGRFAAETAGDCWCLKGCSISPQALSRFSGRASPLWPGITVLAFVLLIAAWAIVSGALMMAAGLRLNIDHGRWWLVLGGLLSLAYGVLLIAAPLIGALVLTWWIGAYPLAFGVVLVVFSFKLRSRQHEGGSPTAARTAA